MHSEPRKIVLTGLVVGAVAIAAVVAQSGGRWLSADESGFGNGGEAARHARGDIMSGAITSGPVVARADSSDASLSGGLRAARSSLQRNDLVAAKAQLDAVAAVHRDNDQVVALQREVRARAQASQQTLVAAQVASTATTQAGANAVGVASSPPSSVKGHRSHERRSAAHDYSTRASGYAKSRHGADAELAGAASERVPSRRAGNVEASVMANQASSVAPTLRVGQGLSSAPAMPPSILQPPSRPLVESLPPPNPPVEMTAQALLPLQSTELQPAATGGTLLKSDGPKTRAQVREEIVRARNNGSLPAFGNPDPAGPGGAPSLTNAPRP